MISLDLAQKLKDTGLKWEPALGQSYKDVVEGGVWLPRLDQLLTEIERRMYDWSMTSNMDIRPDVKPEYYAELYNSDGDMVWEITKQNTATEAAGQALLWILREGE